MVIRPDRSIWVYDHSSVAHPVENEFHAIGAGQEGALVAMHLKHDAKAAVLAVNAVNVLCGGGVDTLSFPSKPQRKT
jgi:hypothetical protein